MSVQGYSASTATIGSASDSYLGRPSGSGYQVASPTIPAAVFQASANSGTAPTQYYTKTNNTTLVLYLPTASVTFTSGSLAGVFWVDASNVQHYCLDCTISIGSPVSGYTPVTIVGAAVAAIAANLSPAQTDFTTVTAGTTQITVSIATLATSDTPSNPDITDYSLPVASVLQLLLTCQTTGAFEMRTSGALVLFWDYTYSGDYYDSLKLNPSALWSGTVVKLRFYNNSLAAQIMSAAALMA